MATSLPGPTTYPHLYGEDARQLFQKREEYRLARERQEALRAVSYCLGGCGRLHKGMCYDCTFGIAPLFL